MQSLFQASQPLDWAAFFKINCNALFETALLFTADPEEAEASIAAVIDHIDASISPDDSELAILQEQLARRAIQKCRQPASSQVAEAGLMLRTDLRPILQIDQCPRICFVLRMLLGYATSTCAQKLCIEKSAVKNLLRVAIIQLQNAVTAKDLPGKAASDVRD